MRRDGLTRDQDGDPARDRDGDRWRSGTFADWLASPGGCERFPTIPHLATKNRGNESGNDNPGISSFPLCINHLRAGFPRKRIHRLIQAVMNPET